jgi:hypothetical protein
MLMTCLEGLLRVLVDGQGTYSNYLNLLRQLSKGMIKALNEGT